MAVLSLPRGDSHQVATPTGGGLTPPHLFASFNVVTGASPCSSDSLAKFAKGLLGSGDWG